MPFPEVWVAHHIAATLEWHLFLKTLSRVRIILETNI